MKRSVIAAVTLCLGAACPGAISNAQAWPGGQVSQCTARVVHSEETPYAWIGSWLASVTLEITPPGGRPFVTIVHHDVTWQRSSPRRGEIFKVRCDPANGILLD